MAGRLYDRRSWHRARKLQLQREPLCERCLAAGKIEPATAVHHRVAVAERPDLSFDPANWESICEPCHARIERAADRGYSTEIGPDGIPLDPRHPAFGPRKRPLKLAHAPLKRLDAGQKLEPRLRSRPLAR